MTGLLAENSFFVPEMFKENVLQRWLLGLAELRISGMGSTCFLLVKKEGWTIVQLEYLPNCMQEAQGSHPEHGGVCHYEHLGGGGRNSRPPLTTLGL